MADGLFRLAAPAMTINIAAAPLLLPLLLKLDDRSRESASACRLHATPATERIVDVS